MPEGRVVCLKELPKDCMELYFRGFKHISLKEDAVEVLKDMCEDDLQYLLKLKKGTPDAKIIQKALDIKLNPAPKTKKSKKTEK